MTALEPLPSCEVTAALIRLGFAITSDRGPEIVLTRPSDGALIAIPNTDPVPSAALESALAGVAIPVAEFLAAV